MLFWTGRHEPRSSLSDDGFHRVSTPTAGVIGFVHESEGRFEVLRGRVRSATRTEGAYRSLDVAVIALTYIES